MRRIALRFASSVCLLALAACSSGGGGGSAAPATAPASTPATTPNTPATTPSTPATPAVSITAPAAGSFSGNPVTTSTGATTPQFIGGTSGRPVGTVFSLNQSVLKYTTTSANDAAIGGATATYQGIGPAGNVVQPFIDLKIPGLGIDARNLSGDGTVQTQADGTRVSASFTTLNYTALGAWSVQPATGTTSYAAVAVTGYQTQASGVPSSGTGVYRMTGGASGVVNIPSGGSRSSAVLGGDTSVNVNFATGGVTGSLSNMQAVGASGTTSWNTVNLAGSLSGAAISGSTSTASPPAGATFGLSSAATGTLSGALYGPNAQELGAVWTLYEPTSDGGKSAFGIMGAQKQ